MVPAQVAVRLQQLILSTLSEIVHHRKGRDRDPFPGHWHNRVAMNLTPPPPQKPAWRGWPFMFVAAVWLVVATQQITLPGVYMDAVDPDYLAVALLNPHSQPISAWLLGGNYLFHRAPFLVSFYHGSQQVWLGLPFFALFGTTVTGLRLTHAMFALGVLAALYALLVRGGLKPWQAALAGAGLAVDPAFSYAFRTQSYITLAPTAWLLLSLYAMQRASTSATRARHWLVASGALQGLAIVGYFIYVFYLPAMALALWLWSRGRPASQVHPFLRESLAPWLLGLAIGGIFYPIGYGLFIRDAGGLSRAWTLFQQTQQSLGAFSATLSLGDRLAHVATMLEAVIGNWFHHQLIFGEYAPLPGSVPKFWLLVSVPTALWLYAEIRGRASTLLRVAIALPVSFATVALIFGNRLQGHHFVPLLPLAYAALAVAMFETAAAAQSGRRGLQACAAIVLAALVALNIAGQAVEARRLAETRGTGYFSDAINRFAADLNALQAKPFLYIPDWGLSMPVAFLTRGTVGMDSVVNLPLARRMLCDGRNVAFAVITGERTARIERWRQELRWGAPAVTPYAQADGKIVFELATFAGQRDAPACGEPH
jgi:hypothetical protein